MLEVMVSRGKDLRIGRKWILRFPGDMGTEASSSEGWVPALAPLFHAHPQGPEMATIFMEISDMVSSWSPLQKAIVAGLLFGWKVSELAEYLHCSTRYIRWVRQRVREVWDA